MVTPITPDGDLDELAVQRIVDHMVDGGVHGVFVLGTTGENTSVPAAMRQRLVAAAVERVGERARVYAGIGSNCLADSVAAAKAYARLGVDAVVAHLPTYYALNAEEQFAYFGALAGRIDLPLLLYDQYDANRSLAHLVNQIGLREKYHRHQARVKPHPSQLTPESSPCENF